MSEILDVREFESQVDIEELHVLAGKFNVGYFWRHMVITLDLVIEIGIWK